VPQELILPLLVLLDLRVFRVYRERLVPLERRAYKGYRVYKEKLAPSGLLEPQEQQELQAQIPR
jgi:hypothetical protein